MSDGELERAVSLRERLRTLRLYTDAAARGNPGHAGTGVVIETTGARGWSKMATTLES